MTNSKETDSSKKNINNFCEDLPTVTINIKKIRKSIKDVQKKKEILSESPFSQE